MLGDISMCQTVWLYLRENATETEVTAWEILKENMKDENLLIIEAESKAILELEHQRLVDEGWKLTHMGSGVFRRISTYSKACPDQMESTVDHDRTADLE
jgi:hypothetical protein